MQVNNPPQQVPFLQCVGGQKIYYKYLDWPPTNMGAVTSKLIAHGIVGAYLKIISIGISMRDDAGINLYQFGIWPNAIPTWNNILMLNFDTTNITLGWSAASDWAVTGNFNSVAINRGRILISFLE